ncbi:unnamed protein product [Vitrella brassicaformis CCMP3155]|uniref:Uncharacterized protein n=1 Tax=Vitrella brassicaformis (strain CCMP3155) TaxID=1169540 RepID=A0A0G4GK86_VITBC|nr:unnamed protein product [Vitrella brassicaformis CCMP3155]|eukprot:CEM30312.1 unnamed protein product [Vitrella brassicaformis CCMP3155]
MCKASARTSPIHRWTTWEVDTTPSSVRNVMGNPEGDPDTQIDPGWREPAAQLSFSQDGPFLSRDMRYLRPVEGWGRPEYSCRKER